MIKIGMIRVLSGGVQALLSNGGEQVWVLLVY